MLGKHESKEDKKPIKKLTHLLSHLGHNEMGDYHSGKHHRHSLPAKASLKGLASSLTGLSKSSKFIDPAALLRQQK